MAELNGLPIYKMKVDKDKKQSGVDFHSFVDNPAIEVLFKTFNKNDKLFKFNSEKQIVTGPFMIPDLPIYRNDHSHGEYYVVFEKLTIQELNEKFMSEQKTLSFNYQHLENSIVNNAVLIENWIVGENDNKAKELGFDVPVGTWMGSVKINNKKFWDEEIKSGNVRGFSIEGFLDMEMKSQKKINMSGQKFEVHKQADGGSDIYIDGGIAVDNYVFSNYPSITLVDGKKQVTQYPVWQEMIVLEDGTILTLKDSKILKIDKKATMSKTKLEAIAKTKDGKTLKTTAENMAIGVDVVVVADDMSEIIAPDGEYELESGEMVTVLEGKITAITEASNEDLTAEETAIIQTAMAPVIKTLQDKIAELELKLSNIPAAGSSTEEKPEPKTKLSAKMELRKKLSFMKDRNKELEKYN